MKEIRFEDWASVLAQSQLSEKQKRSWEITLRWYLNFCRRARVGVTVHSAREFIEWAQQEKQAQAWQVAGWKEAINWFFRAARISVSGSRGQVSGENHRSPLPNPPPIAAQRREGVRSPDKNRTSILRITATEDKSNIQHPASNEETTPHLTPDTPHLTPSWKSAFLTVVRRRHYSYRTEQSYLVWIQRFARFCRSDDLAARGSDDVKAFLDGLARDERLSASSQRQALNAVVFLLREVYGKELGDFSDYRRAKIRTHAPSWLTFNEVTALLKQLDERWALLTCVAFGGGLRLMELLRLRIKDVDLEQEIITVRAGKGNRDRLTTLAHVVVEPLRAHLAKVRRIHEQDRQAGVARVWLPDGLERKYPKAGEEWPWFWLWPDDHLSVDPRTGIRRRHHVSDRLFQLRIKEAATKARLNKRVTPHVLRHSFASQSLDGGMDIGVLKELLGHKSVETTMIYAHAMRKPGLGVRSPLDRPA
jgi:integron integrase